MWFIQVYSSVWKDLTRNESQIKALYLFSFLSSLFKASKSCLTYYYDYDYLATRILNLLNYYFIRFYYSLLFDFFITRRNSNKLIELSFLLFSFRTQCWRLQSCPIQFHSPHSLIGWSPDCLTSLMKYNAHIIVILLDSQAHTVVRRADQNIFFDWFVHFLELCVMTQEPILRKNNLIFLVCEYQFLNKIQMRKYRLYYFFSNCELKID